MIQAAFVSCAKWNLPKERKDNDLLDFKQLEAEDVKNLVPFFGKRPNKTCDSVILDSFLWREYYHVRFAISGGKAIQWLMEDHGRICSAMPVCAEEDLEFFFEELVTYFNKELKKPLRIGLADEEAVHFLRLKEQTDRFEVIEQEDLKDYLYDGEAMRTLSGKKLHKKKNNLNAFRREYEGRYEYRPLCCSDRDEVLGFLSKWRDAKGDSVEEHLDYEVRGIHSILKNCSGLPIRMGSVYVDEKLEAFTIGSYNETEKMAIIHIEKANPEMRGLYQYINQQFLQWEFPDAQLVNREDDLGLLGLRKAKMSYQPIGFARKYLIRQIDFS